jgi:hypothetical protein
MGLCQSQPNIVINDGFHIRSRHAIVIGNRMFVPIGNKNETKNGYPLTCRTMES